MACDSITLVNLVAADGLDALSERDILLCLAGVYGTNASLNATQAVALAATNKYSALSDHALDECFLGVIC